MGKHINKRVLKPMKPLLERFFSKVLKPSDPDGCWTWLGGWQSNGYGFISVYHQGNKLAHRVSYEIHKGPVADDICVLHKCDNRRCVNPNHLFLGTYKDNSDDKVKKLRHQHGDSHSKAKVSSFSVLTLRALFAAGMPADVIEKSFGISYPTVMDISFGRSWGHEGGILPSLPRPQKFFRRNFDSIAV